MSRHIEITVKTAPLWSEHVSHLLIDKLGCTGTLMEKSLVKGYLPCVREPDLSVLGEWEVSTKIIKDEEWAHNWKKYWHPQKIGQKIVICPSWEKYTPQNGETIISLDPGSAFGTGTHPTTRLCIRAIEQAMPQLSGETSMADVGTGSGILAISGAKLGFEKVTGVDKDPSVIPVAAENALKNGVSDKCGFFAGSASDIGGKYDLVVSNILAEVIIDMTGDLKKLLKPDGMLILSGITDSKIPHVESALNKADLRVFDISGEEKWAAIKAGL